MAWLGGTGKHDGIKGGSKFEVTNSGKPVVEGTQFQCIRLRQVHPALVPPARVPKTHPHGRRLTGRSPRFWRGCRIKGFALGRAAYFSMACSTSALMARFMRRT